MQTFSVKLNALKFNDRMVPVLYYYTEILKEQFIKNGLEYCKLGDYATISDGEHSAIPRNNKQGVRYLYGRNIREGVVDFDPISDDSFISVDDYDYFNRCHIKQNDILIAIYGTVGKSAIYKEEYIGKAGIPRHIANITLAKGAPFTPEYLTSFFRSKYGKWQIASLITGNIQQLLSLKNLREFDVPLIDTGLMKEISVYEAEALNCEINSQMKIKRAQELFYQGLKFDPQKIKRDFSFNVKYSQLNKDDIWTTSYYDKLYVNMAKSLEKYNGVKTLREIVDVCHGDEVGSDNYNTFIDRTQNDKPFIRTSDIVNNEVDIYPDYYVNESVLTDLELAQDIIPSDIIFTKDGKVGCVGMITETDNVILSNGIERLRLKQEAKEHGFTQEYLFTALSVKEVGLYAARRRTVIASTIPHLREDRLLDIEIPIMDKTIVDNITMLIREAFALKSRRKEIIRKSDTILEKYFSP